MDMIPATFACLFDCKGCDNLTELKIDTFIRILDYRKRIEDKQNCSHSLVSIQMCRADVLLVSWTRLLQKCKGIDRLRKTWFEQTKRIGFLYRSLGKRLLEDVSRGDRRSPSAAPVPTLQLSIILYKR